MNKTILATTFAGLWLAKKFRNPTPAYADLK
jgi:hypothetical protein